MEYLSNLNDVQKKIVVNTEGPMRIIAGPGAGKTRVLTSRVAFLIGHNKVDPSRILVLTFTNKAAKEMKERVSSVIETDVPRNLYTFHGFAYRFLRQEWEAAGLSQDFKIIDTADRKKILRQLATNLGMAKSDYKDAMLSSFVSSAKHSRDLTTYPDFQYDLLDSLLIRYKTRQASEGLLDFDDLITYTKDVLTKNSDVRERWSAKYDYILVDEYQDTSWTQELIVQGLLNNNKNITVVGDPDQTIYSFRGSNLSIFNNFPERHPGSRDFFLSQNYRSTGHILKAANELIKKNTSSFDRILVTDNDDGREVSVLGCLDLYDEANTVVREIEGFLRAGVDPDDIVLLYRSNYLTSAFEKSFQFASIPYKVHGGFKFYDREEVKDALAYVSSLVRGDNVSAERIINVPSRKIGKITEEKIRIAAFKGNYSIVDLIIEEQYNDIVSGKVALELKKLGQAFAVARKAIDDNEEAVLLIENLLKTVGYMNEEVIGKDRVDNIRQLLDNISQFGKTLDGASTKVILSEFTSSIALTTSMEEEEQPSVKLMTAHTSKGLEFKHVFIVSMTNRAWEPKDPSEEEEERRLFYVAITRAMKTLTISYNMGVDYSGNLSNKSKLLREVEPALGTSIINRISNVHRPSDVFKDNKNIQANDVIVHNIFGEGRVLSDYGDTISVQFSTTVGIKELTKNHFSITKKE